MKKSLLNIITLVLVVTNTILTAMMVFVVVPSMQDSNAVIKKVAQAINLELKEDDGGIDLTDLPIEDCITYDLDKKLTISLKKGSDGKSHYAVIYPALLLYKDHKDYKKYSETIEEKKAVITQHIEDIVKNYTATELQTNPEAIRQEILKDLQKLYDSEFIVQVIFGTTTIQ